MVADNTKMAALIATMADSSEEMASETKCKPR
jgi:hypothetical protein